MRPGPGPGERKTVQVPSRTEQKKGGALISFLKSKTRRGRVVNAFRWGRWEEQTARLEVEELNDQLDVRTLLSGDGVRGGTGALRRSGTRKITTSPPEKWMKHDYGDVK